MDEFQLVSTILVFSVAFGISVDDTIHFLAKHGKNPLQWLEHPSGGIGRCP